MELHDNSIEIGGHPVKHPSLGRVGENQAKEELFGYVASLTKNLGAYPRTFCYPNDQRQDFTPVLPGIGEPAGFCGAVTVFPDAQGVAEHYLMRCPASGADMFQFFKPASGLDLIGLQLLKDVLLDLKSNGTVTSYVE